MKDPAFLFYPNDYIGGTMGMTFEEKGAYIELLMMQFNRGHMTEHMIGQTVGQLWVKLQDKFIKDEQGLWYNKRLEIEQENRKRFTESRKNNIKGTNQHTKNKGHIKGHMTSHMEDINEDNKYKEVFNKYCEHLKSVSVYERLAMNRNIKPTEIIHCINEFIDTCYASIMEKKNKFEVEEYFLNWVKKDGRVLECINNQHRKNGTKK